MSSQRSEAIDMLFSKVDRDENLTLENAVELLNIENGSSDFYRLLAKAQELTYREYKNRGYVFVQIGLNSRPCPGNCRFCSMGLDNFVVEEETEKTETEVVEEAKRAAAQGIDALFLMTTADYDIEKFLEISRSVKAVLPEDVMLVANIGDFGEETARRLKEAGVTGVYHIVRLNEGIDTDLDPADRIRTLDAVRSAGLELIYCVEPIGPEHTYEQIAGEMLRAREYDVNIMACMKRVCVKGTPLYERGEITDLELTKIAAVTRLVTRPKTSMNVHEPKQITLLAGVNQLYAEIGINPRDCAVETGMNRGCSIADVKEMLRQVGYRTR
ncbi:radical SAM protein [Lachnoclostridium sp. An169]|uniref:radical SAM protein n=1 Tax=Lachnoclostridium sp. An169 TaxID=1965569 RepID=UPI000B559C38|nr:radical SAM protein [Lachnoclostridium sp. An169]OUP83955.1 radical SAM protein [Lachnoclostridium sp. An169]